MPCASYHNDSDMIGVVAREHRERAYGMALVLVRPMFDPGEVLRKATAISLRDGVNIRAVVTALLPAPDTDLAEMAEVADAERVAVLRPVGGGPWPVPVLGCPVYLVRQAEEVAA